MPRICCQQTCCSEQEITDHGDGAGYHRVRPLGPQAETVEGQKRGASNQLTNRSKHTKAEETTVKEIRPAAVQNVWSARGCDAKSPGVITFPLPQSREKHVYYFEVTKVDTGSDGMVEIGIGKQCEYEDHPRTHYGCFEEWYEFQTVGCGIKLLNPDDENAPTKYEVFWNELNEEHERFRAREVFEAPREAVVTACIRLVGSPHVVINTGEPVSDASSEWLSELHDQSDAPGQLRLDTLKNSAYSRSAEIFPKVDPSGMPPCRMEVGKLKEQLDKVFDLDLIKLLNMLYVQERTSASEHDVSDLVRQVGNWRPDEGKYHEQLTAFSPGLTPARLEDALQTHEDALLRADTPDDLLRNVFERGQCDLLEIVLHNREGVLVKKDRSGFTNLHRLYRNKDLSARLLRKAREILQTKIDHDVHLVKSSSGDTPLHWLFLNPSLTPDMLSSEGLSREARRAMLEKNSAGKTPFDYLCEHPRFSSELLTAALTQFLDDEDADDVWCKCLRERVWKSTKFGTRTLSAEHVGLILGEERFAEAERKQAERTDGATLLHDLCHHRRQPFAPSLLRVALDKGVGDMGTLDKENKTPLQYLCANEDLTPQLLQEALEISGKPTKMEDPPLLSDDGSKASTALHRLCANRALNRDLLNIALTQGHLPRTALTHKKNEDGDTPLHNLCLNPELTPPVLDTALRRAREDGTADAMLLKNAKGDTPLVSLVKNGSNMEEGKNQLDLLEIALKSLPKGVALTGEALDDISKKPFKDPLLLYWFCTSARIHLLCQKKIAEDRKAFCGKMMLTQRESVGKDTPFHSLCANPSLNKDILHEVLGLVEGLASMGWCTDNDKELCQQAFACADREHRGHLNKNDFMRFFVNMAEDIDMEDIDEEDMPDDDEWLDILRAVRGGEEREDGEGDEDLTMSRDELTAFVMEETDGLADGEFRARLFQYVMNNLETQSEEAKTTGEVQAAMLTQGAHNLTPLHALAANRSLTYEMLKEALKSISEAEDEQFIPMVSPEGAVAKKTPLHRLCSNACLGTEEGMKMLTQVLKEVKKQQKIQTHAMLCEDEDNCTPLHLLCENESLTPELLNHVLGNGQLDSRPKSDYISNEDDEAGKLAPINLIEHKTKRLSKTPLHNLCGNRSLTPDLLWTALQGFATYQDSSGGHKSTIESLQMGDDKNLMLYADEDTQDAYDKNYFNGICTNPSLTISCLEVLPESMLEKMFESVERCASDIMATPDVLQEGLKGWPPQALEKQWSKKNPFHKTQHRETNVRSGLDILYEHREKKENIWSGEDWKKIWNPHCSPLGKIMHSNDSSSTNQAMDPTLARYVVKAKLDADSGGAAAAGMEIYVNTPAGKVVHLEVDQNASFTIGQLKSLIEESENIRADLQVLKFSNDTLDDDSTLEDCEIHKESVLDLAIAPPPRICTEELNQMFRSGLDALAIDLLQAYGVADVNYSLIHKNPNSMLKNSTPSMDGSVVHYSGSFNFSRVEMGSRDSRELVTAPCEEENPSFYRYWHQKKDTHWEKHQGIDWAKHMTTDRYSNDNDDRIEVKPVVLGVQGAAAWSHEGLLHVLVQPTCPPEVFNSPIAQILVYHKWATFGRDMFRTDVAFQSLLLLAWQSLASMISHHGHMAVVVDFRQALGGVLVALMWVFWKRFCAHLLLPLRPRSARTTLGWRSWLRWIAYDGWKDDAKIPVSSPLVLAASHIDPISPLAVLVWFVIIVGYYALALISHFGPIYGSFVLLGGSLSSIGNFGPSGTHSHPHEDDVVQHSIAAASIAVLVALIGRYIDKEWRQLTGSEENHHSGSEENHSLQKKSINATLWLLYAEGFLRRCVKLLRQYFGGPDGFWNILDVATLVLIITTIGRTIASSNAQRTLHLCVITTILLWFRAVQMLQGFDQTAKYVSMIFEISKDMRSFIFILAMFVFSNGFALSLLFPMDLASVWSEMGDANGHDSHGVDRLWVDPDEVSANVGNLYRSMFSSFNMMMGAFDPAMLRDAQSPPLAYAVYLYYTTLVNVVLLNLLIALMVSTLH